MNEYIAGVLADCVTALNCPRGKFYPDKNYGSRIKTAGAVADDEALLRFAQQALDNMDGICVKSACQRNNCAEFILLINNEEEEVILPL